MKFTIPRLELVSLIAKVQAIVPTKPTPPILGHVLIEAKEGQIIVSATDLTTSIRAFTKAQVDEEGSFALPAKKLFQLIREVTAPYIEVSCSPSEGARINAGTSHFKMSGMNKHEFPTFPDFSSGTQFSIYNKTLKEMLTRSSFAASRDDNRQVLNGILFQSINKTATFIGTDGKRLAKLRTLINQSENIEGSYILPLKAVEEIIKLLDKDEDSSELTLMTDKVSIEVDSLTLISKLLFGKYPDVARVIPQKAADPILLHREELMSLLRQVSLFIPEPSSAVRFTFAPGELSLSAISTDIGEGKASMAVNYAGPQFQVAFNPHSFIDVLRHSKDEIVQLTLTDSFNPGLITDSTEAEFVIMPMRLDA
jgi:DNA polymerase-3 subunit beta